MRRTEGEKKRDSERGGGGRAMKDQEGGRGCIQKSNKQSQTKTQTETEHNFLVKTITANQVQKEDKAQKTDQVQQRQVTRYMTDRWRRKEKRRRVVTQQ